MNAHTHTHIHVQLHSWEIQWDIFDIQNIYPQRHLLQVFFFIVQRTELIFEEGQMVRFSMQYFIKIERDNSR